MAADISLRRTEDREAINVFSLSQTASPFMRFNVAQCQSSKVFEVLEKAMG